MVGPPGKSAHVTVMTRNLYIGADVDPIIEAAAAGLPELIPGLVDQAFQTMMFTNYPERAGAIADEIAAADPDLIGLQEGVCHCSRGNGDRLPGDSATAPARPWTGLLRRRLDQEHGCGRTQRVGGDRIAGGLRCGAGPK